MNKKISTVFMAALLMVGAPLSSVYAEGIPTEAAYVAASDLELKNGVKFYLGTSNNLFPTTEVELDGGTKVITFGTPTALNATTTAVFEVCDYAYQANGDISTFSLKVKGQYVYAKLASSATTAAAAADKAKDVTKAFQVKGKKIHFDGIYAALPGATALQANGSNAVAFTATKELEADDLNEAKGGSFSLKYAATELAEPNIFDQKIVAITLNAAITTNGTGKLADYKSGNYFAIGVKDADLAAVVAAADGKNELNNDDEAKAFFDKTTFIVLDDENNFDLDALNGEGEGYKFKTVKGEKINKDNSANAMFTVNEFDCVNNSGEYRLSLVNPTVASSATIYAGAIKATPTDTKVYITTVVADKAGKLISATFNGTNWVPASALLKENAMNTVSIYFTSGTPSTSTDPTTGVVTEYHKYLVLGVDATPSAYELHANAADDVDFTSPAAQWVVNGFDGKSTFTLVNRENPATSVKLTLATTSTAGVYEIVDAGGEEIDNISATVGTNNNAKALAGKKVKFTSLTTTNRDGFLNLAADEMKGIELVFSGANAAVGEKTYYGAFTYTTGSTPALDKYAPSLESAASYFDFEKAKNAAGKVDYIMNEVEYAYLDANGVVAAEKDTLYVASYKLKAAKDKYLKDDFAYDATGGEFIFKKNLNGTYAMLPVATAGSGVYGTEIAYNAQVVSVNATTPLAFAANVEYLYGNNAKSFSNVSFSYSSEATSLEAVPQHVLFDSSLGAISMQQSDKGFMEGIVSGKGTDADFTLWLDTADSKAAIPSFYISKGITKTKAEEAAETRLFLYNSVDSMSYWTEGSAVMTPDPDYVLAGTTATPKAIFRAAALNHPDTLATVVDGEEVALVMKDADASKGQKNGLNRYRFNIVLADEEVDGEYVIKNGSKYLYNLNGCLGFTSAKAEALVVTLGEGDATSNEEAPAVETVKVIAGNGQLTIAGAQGKKVVISNILGQVVANTVVSSDNATIAAPQGIVVVAVEGEEAVKAIVK